MSIEPADRASWLDRPHLNLFAPDNLAVVEAALSRRGAVVFGWHYSFKGGSNRDEVVFTTPGDYLRHIERARPGDHLTLFDLDQVAERSFLHVGSTESSARYDLTDGENDLVDRALKDDGDLFAVRRFVGPLTSVTEARLEWLDETDGEEQLMRARIQWTWERGELFLFRTSVFDEDSEGGHIESVSPLERIRINALVDAKRPRQDGTVPLTGPY